MVRLPELKPSPPSVVTQRAQDKDGSVSSQWGFIRCVMMRRVAASRRRYGLHTPTGARRRSGTSNHASVGGSGGGRERKRDD
jgi:hypothetical protein